MSLPSHVGKICPCCSAPIKPDSRVVVCPACQVVHHAECWRYNNGCTTFGCRQASAAQPSPQRPVTNQPHAEVNLQAEEPSTALVPVWAPNPDVPLTARFLAYSFAGFMVLALLLAIFTNRPPDVPPLPEDNQWQTYTVDSQYTIQYPTGWVVDKEQTSAGTELLFKLWQNSPVNVVVIVQPLPASYDPSTAEAMRAGLEGKVAENFEEYQAQDRYSGAKGTLDWQRFSFRERGEKSPMTGAWTTFIKDRYNVIVIGGCPLDGRTVMEAIQSKMAESVSVVNSKPQTAEN